MNLMIRLMKLRWVAMGSMGCLILCSSANAQDNTLDLLKQGMRGAVATFTPVSQKEQDEVLRKVAELLVARVTFRDDGTASSVHHYNGRATHVEWKKLKVSQIWMDAVTEADRSNGITRRYHASFSCEASRSWNRTEGAWTKWLSTGYFMFPRLAKIEEIDGKLVARLDELGRFLPGPGGVPVVSQPVKKGEIELPAGMSRRGGQ